MFTQGTTPPRGSAPSTPLKPVIGVTPPWTHVRTHRVFWRTNTGRCAPIGRNCVTLDWETSDCTECSGTRPLRRRSHALVAVTRDACSGASG
jgi:hypothetical protein